MRHPSQRCRAWLTGSERRRSSCGRTNQPTDIELAGPCVIVLLNLIIYENCIIFKPPRVRVCMCVFACPFASMLPHQSAEYVLVCASRQCHDGYCSFFFWVTAFLELDQQMATDIVGQCSITMRWACRSWPTCSRVDNGSVVHGSWVKLVTISGWVTRASSRDLLTHDSVDQIYPKLSAQWLKWSCQGELPHQTVKNIDHL